MYSGSQNLDTSQCILNLKSVCSYLILLGKSCAPILFGGTPKYSQIKETKSKDVVYGIPAYALREKIYLLTTFKPRYHRKHRAGRVITTMVK
jgi:hypothetical protein